MKPQDFLIGIRDFFAILVPGAVVLILLAPQIPEDGLFETNLFRFVGFAIAAYLIGSVADRLGALLDYVVNPVLRHPWLRRIAKRAAASEDEAKQCRTQLLKSCGCSALARMTSVSDRSFWWDHLRLSSPPAIEELDRIEGTQKLFRSLTAGFLFLASYYGMGFTPSLQPWLPAGTTEAAWAMLVFGVISASLYGLARFSFRAAVFRLAVAYWVQQRAGRGPPGARQ